MQWDQLQTILIEDIRTGRTVGRPSFDNRQTMRPSRGMLMT
jgi:hypothetical protein